MGRSSSRISMAVVDVDLEKGPAVVQQQPEAAAAAAELQMPSWLKGDTNIYREKEAERRAAAWCGGVLLGCFGIGLVVMTWLYSRHDLAATLYCASICTILCLLRTVLRLQDE